MRGRVRRGLQQILVRLLSRSGLDWRGCACTGAACDVRVCCASFVQSYATAEPGVAAPLIVCLTLAL